MSNFKVGEKLVCISNIILEEKEILLGVKCPLVNEIYTIRSISNRIQRYTKKPCLGIQFEEIINPSMMYLNGFTEIKFAHFHFRKLDYQFSEEVLSNIKEQVKSEELCHT